MAERAGVQEPIRLWPKHAVGVSTPIQPGNVRAYYRFRLVGHVPEREGITELWLGLN